MRLIERKMSIALTSNLPESYVIKKFYQLGFGVKSENNGKVYYCSCPICHEGKSFGKKRRCYYLVDKDIIYCHNCGWSSRPIKSISQVEGLSYKEIYEEAETEGEFIDLDNKHSSLGNLLTENILESNIDDDLPSDSINLSDKLQKEYYKNNPIVSKAIKYLAERRLELAINAPKSFYVSLSDKVHEGRLVVPFRDFNDNVIFYQSRAIGASLNEELESVKYLSKKDGIKSIFNIEKIDDSIEPIFIFEGPFDSCFTKNGIAVGGITPGKSKFNNLQNKQLSLFRLNHSFIWVLDNQWVDYTAKEKTLSLLEDGERVFIWPKELKNYKDFNDICVENNINEIPWKFIIENTLQGTVGLLKFKLLFKN